MAWDYHPDNAVDAREMCAKGWSKTRVAKALGMSKLSVFNNLMKKNPEFAQAVEEGRRASGRWSNHNDPLT